MRGSFVACCARAVRGHAAALPSSVMKSRRFMSSIGDFLPYALSEPPTGPCSVFRSFSPPQGGPQVPGADLKCSESRRRRPAPHCLYHTRITQMRATHGERPAPRFAGDDGCENKRGSPAEAGLSTKSAK